MDQDFFSKDLKNQPGGVIICDSIDNNLVILLGKSNIPKRSLQLEGFGGKKEKQDITSLHTAIRELTEEFFNIKLETDIINDLALNMRKNNLILKQYQFYGMSYLINFTGLNYIFQYIKKYNELEKYDDNNNFNIHKYTQERIINDIPNDGLNEINQIYILQLDDIKNKKYNLRWFTKKIIQIML